MTPVLTLVHPLRRDATRVIFEILWVSVTGASKTQILFKANLSYRLSERYIQFLVERGLLKREPDALGSAKYFLTEKGERFLALLREVERELNGFFVRAPSSGIIVQNRS